MTGTSTQGGLQREPAYRLTLDGRDITAKIDPRLISLTLTQCRGGEADQLDLVLDDSDGQLALPRTGVTLALAIGWAGAELVNKGSFVVDEVEHVGAPDQVQIRARSADLREGLRRRIEQSWHETTLGAITRTIAGRNGVRAQIDPGLASKAIAHIDQIESDIGFITRLARRHDAVATVKAGCLIVVPINGSRNAAGQPLPTIELVRSAGDQHRYHCADRDAYTGARAYWHDPKRAKQRSVLVGQGGNAKRLRESHANEADARSAAQAEWQRIQRGAATFELTLAIGLASADAQSPLSVSGFKPEIDGTDWLIKKVTHAMGDGGFTTAIEAERQGTDSTAGEAQDVG